MTTAMPPATRRVILRRRIRLLVAATNAYNVAEAAGAIASSAARKEGRDAWRGDARCTVPDTCADGCCP
ncbi:hypothetical protein [Nonomuraea typhae]|uniref:Uncharacterized protein n=1 Tax=Nonomuraea typhae TaxID=2603600 RepID=A0ABW7Z0X3_9ACTN